MSQGTRLIIVDDDPIVLFGLQKYLEHESIVVEAIHADAESALASAATWTADVVLADINLGDVDGFELTARLRDVVPTVKTVLMTTSPARDAVDRALRVGAYGLLPKSAPPEAFHAAVFAARAECFVVHGLRPTRDEPDAAAVTRPRSLDVPLGVAPLTTRERDVLDLILEARTTRQIASRLDLSESTVKSHTTAIFTKFSVHSRTELLHLIFEGRQPG